jgi:dCMP deaminase
MNRILTFEEVFMNLSIIIAKRSKDPNTQVGATIVNNNKVIGMGYNGFPIIDKKNNININNDQIYPWSKLDLNNKYLYVVHAELNAILNSNKIPKNSVLYTTLFPCNECAKAIIQSGIKTVYYLDIKNIDKIEHKATLLMFKYSNIKLIKIDELYSYKISYFNFKNINIHYKYLFILFFCICILLILFIYSL